MAKYKEGRFTLDEIEYIEQNYKKIEVKLIAKHLSRKASSVKRYITEHIVNPGKSIAAQNLRLEYDIKTRPYWKDIEAQFTEDELPLFVYYWEKTISQFKDDVLPTEELQIVDMVKIELLMSRGLKQQNTNQQNIALLEKLLVDEQAQNVPDPMKVNSLSTQVALARSAQTAWSKEFQELSNRKLAILKELKATRQQRVKNLESSKANFIGMLAELIENKNIRKEWGEYIEKMRVATEVEMRRLTDYHQYNDGVVDQPIFTAETAKEDNVLS